MEIGLIIAFLVLLAPRIWSWLRDQYRKCRSPAEIFIGKEESLCREAVEKTALFQRGPRPPFWLMHGHIQLLKYVAEIEYHQRRTMKYERHVLQVPTTDHAGNDLGQGEIAVDMHPAMDDAPRDTPCVVVLPGMRGYFQDNPNGTLPGVINARGWRCVVFIRRGHLGRQVTSPQVDMFGNYQDTIAQMRLISREFKGAPLFIYGLSCGAAVGLEFLGKIGQAMPKELQEHPPNIIGSYHVCGGYQMSADLTKNCVTRMPSKLLNRILTSCAKDHFIRRHDAIKRHHKEAHIACTHAENMCEFWQNLVRISGYPDFESYCETKNPMNHVDHVTVPTVLINSADDPAVDVGNVYENMDCVHRNPNLAIVLSQSGTHMPFDDIASGNFFSFRWRNWSEEAGMDFFQNLLDLRPTQGDSHATAPHTNERRRASDNICFKAKFGTEC